MSLVIDLKSMPADPTPQFALQLASEAQVKPAGYDHFYKVLRMLAQWELLDESDDRTFSANLATRQLVPFLSMHGRKWQEPRRK